MLVERFTHPSYFLLFASILGLLSIFRIHSWYKKEPRMVAAQQRSGSIFGATVPFCQTNFTLHLLG
jgi:hypothetical protein